MARQTPDVFAVRQRVLEHGRLAPQRCEHLVRNRVDEVVRVEDVDVAELHVVPLEIEHVSVLTLHSPAVSDQPAPHLVYERDGHVAVLTMNRPEAKNALSGEMLVRMYDAWVDVDQDPELRVGILTGAGGTFCSGMDLKAFAGDTQADNPYQKRFEEDSDLHWKALLRHFR